VVRIGADWEERRGRRLRVTDFAAYALLLFALLGYACFPSKPSNGIEIAERLAPVSLSAALSADLTQKYRIPKQEQEYRARSVSFDAIAAETGDVPSSALARVVTLVLPEIETAIVRIGPTPASSEQARVKPSARGPPSIV
jgi:hypothetical protein